MKSPTPWIPTNGITILMSSLIAATLICVATPHAMAQDYWEYDRWEGEWEHHYPTEGLKYEYEDDGDVEAEEEQYEWEAGEGYHEQEWYDPSDWFTTGRDLDYESDDYYDAPYYDYEYDTDEESGDDVYFRRWYWIP